MFSPIKAVGPQILPIVTFLAILAITSAAPAWATHDQTFGLGGMSSGRVGSVTSDPENPAAALSNPSLLPLASTPHFAFSTSFVGTQRDPIAEVTLDSPDFRTVDGKERTGDYVFPSTGNSLWAASLQYPFALPAWTRRRAGIGIVTSGPFGNLRNYRSGTAYDFSTLRYGTSDSQFKASLAGGFEIIPEKLAFGLGVSLFISTAGDADTLLLAENPAARLNLDVGLNTTVVSGLTYHHRDLHSDHFFSLTYRQAAVPRFEQRLTGRVDLGVGRGPAEVPFRLKALLYYEPEVWELEWQGVYGRVKTSVGLSFQKWAAYESSVLVLETINADRAPVRTQTPPLAIADTWNPRASIEIPLSPRLWTLGAGYQFRPSPITNLSGAANLLDTDTHIVGGAIRYRFLGNEWFPLPMAFSVHGQFHHFSARQVTKAEARYIGGPSYVYSGNAYNVGILAETTF